MEKRTVSIKEASKVFGLSVSTLYKRSAERSIPLLKVGGKILIPIREFSDWLNEHRVDKGANGGRR